MSTGTVGVTGQFTARRHPARLRRAPIGATMPPGSAKAERKSAEGQHATQGKVVPQEGFEPPTPSLRMTCSTS
jgi:hypothetical protein